MRAVIQRVKESYVKVDGETVGKIGKGLLILLGIGREDTDKDLKWMEDKIPNLRIFEDENDKMNRSLIDIGGEILVISQFTLYGDASHGRRPSFSEAAPPDMAREMYLRFCEDLSLTYPALKVERGIFQAKMEVYIVNDGPVTIIVDSKA
ncbi:D-aminoacyl-tRNA deacylase [Athalassotoga saccharophila]|uniref:D-aminoacyl-tRNA deacylase n=1 Tax=Athalassotoga saccharophila TaxID=1441386 RepID=UPI00137B7EB8|nr:D-aminoacyl-tRNA deacylase [Athalassotoga saccharophila]BBJ28182.1 D-aminoacyl-tRNA deacylase [Athalassotoga saccharophila]